MNYMNDLPAHLLQLVNFLRTEDIISSTVDDGLASQKTHEKIIPNIQHLG